MPEQSPAVLTKTGPALDLPHADGRTLEAVENQASDCKRCDLYKHATQLIFGEGNPHAPLMLVGEQPGDREDIAGRPFVGPAGQLLNACLAEAGVDREQCYVTNAVKHFKFTQRGKRRLHSKPNAGEIQRCAWWLGAEIDLLKPKLIVALGATALYTLLGRSVKVTQAQGRVFSAGGQQFLVTIHPSYLLRIRDREDRERIRRSFVDHLGLARDYLLDRKA